MTLHERLVEVVGNHCYSVEFCDLDRDERKAVKEAFFHIQVKDAKGNDVSGVYAVADMVSRAILENPFEVETIIRRGGEMGRDLDSFVYGKLFDELKKSELWLKANEG
jgi:hypothetical protein